MTARTAVAVLYLLGFMLVVSGAVAAWGGARKRLRVLTSLDTRVRANCDRYYELDRQIALIEPSAEEQERNGTVRAEQEALEDDQTHDLLAAGIRRHGTPIQDAWVPQEITSELILLRAALGSVRGAGLCALLGGAVSTVASVWSLYL